MCCPPPLFAAFFIERDGGRHHFFLRPSWLRRSDGPGRRPEADEEAEEEADEESEEKEPCAVHDHNDEACSLPLPV